MSRRGRPKTPGILTPREEEALELIRQGLSNREIAARLGLTLAGAKFHVSEIISKLGVATREEAAAWRPQLHSPGITLLSPLALARRAVQGALMATSTVFRALLIAVVIVFVVVLWQYDQGGGTPRGTPTPETHASLNQEIESGEPVSLIGEVTQQRGAVFILNAGPNPLDPETPFGRPRFFIDLETTVLGPSSNTPLAGGLRAIKEGDLLVVDGVRESDGSVRAKIIRVNAFFNRHGMITEIGPDFIYVRLQSSSAPFGLDVAPTRFKIDQQARMLRRKLSIAPQDALSSPITPEPLKLEVLRVGDGVGLMGTIASDGTAIARYVSVVEP